MSVKKDRVGETQWNKQGLLMRIVEYRNNKDMTIEFVATGERRKCSYLRFKRRLPVANLRDYPAHTDCKPKTAIAFIISMGILALAAIGGLIFAIL